MHRIGSNSIDFSSTKKKINFISFDGSNFLKGVKSCSNYLEFTNFNIDYRNSSCLHIHNRSYSFFTSNGFNLQYLSMQGSYFKLNFKFGQKS